ncbi:nuclear transport factor 2 family protein [Phreatobacter sp. AB_2022a]|uniref:nuclear transport factor 2 family protein n=1 Tax=Phreatobacter sp. AB_2022a TaxID=3003134 RepID=UPI0022871FEF|nr:nuclear transport factor 2 family protein [Phreatobacter sp. AB_2022a]MCZ0738704.1 nuclear transport factor 2 family protein [Phreatobacter sp. AB_2022a]
MPAPPNGPRFGPAARRHALRAEIDAFYAARMACDVDAFTRYFTPDARFFVLGNPVLNANSGLRIGRADIGTHLRTVHASNSYRDFTIRSLVAEADAVAVWWRVHITVRSTGSSGLFDSFDQMRLRNGQIAELSQFYDTGAFAMLVGRLAPPEAL